MNRLSVIGAVIALAALAAYTLDMGSQSEITGVVKDVRITTAIIQAKKGNAGAVGGALVGALIAGPVGAVVGAAAGNGHGQVTVLTKLLGCKMIVEADNQTIVYTFGEHGGVNCSLQKRGDKISIDKIWFSDGVIQYNLGGIFGETGEILLN